MGPARGKSKNKAQTLINCFARIAFATTTTSTTGNSRVFLMIFIAKTGTSIFYFEASLVSLTRILLNE